jgi:UDP-N-acetylmuramate--alanine ligase
MCHKEDLPALIENSTFDVLVTLGAGDIEDYATRIQEIVNKKV